MLKRIARVTALILILAVFTSGALAVTVDFGYGATGKTSKKVTKKISKKVIKTKKAAKKTYKKTKKTTIKYGTKTIKNTSTQKVTQKKTVNKKIVTTAKQNQKKKIKKMNFTGLEMWNWQRLTQQKTNSFPSFLMICAVLLLRFILISI